MLLVFDLCLCPPASCQAVQGPTGPGIAEKINTNSAIQLIENNSDCQVKENVDQVTFWQSKMSSDFVTETREQWLQMELCEWHRSRASGRYDTWSSD
jgi:hypothetical protein